MVKHKIVQSLLSITLRRIELLTTELAMKAAWDISNQANGVKDVDPENIIEHTREITTNYVDSLREVIFGHVVQTLHQDVSMSILTGTIHY